MKRFLVLLLPLACTRLEVSGAPTENDGGPGDTSTPDLGELDAGERPDRELLDLGPSVDTGPGDTGPLTEGPCRLSEGDRVRAVELPGRRFSLAVHVDMETSDTPDLDGLALDGYGVSGFALRTALPPGVDPATPSSASRYIDLIVDPLSRGVIPGVIGVATRVDETLKQAFDHRGFFAARTVRRVAMGNDVFLSRVRAGLLAAMSGSPVGALASLPVPPNEAPVREFTLAAFVESDDGLPGANVVLALSPTSSVSSDLNERRDAIMSDLSNGTHVGPANPRLGIACETSTVSPIQVDFIWVVDNSASMQEEQQALAQAGNGREQGLEFAARALVRARTASAAEERLRPQAVPVVVFYSDEDSTNLSDVDQYAARLSSEGALAFAIVGPRPRGCLAVGRGAARVGESYIRVAERLGGTTASVCSEDLSGPIDEILIAAAGAASGNRLSEEPVSGSLEVAFPEGLLPRSRARGFEYEASSSSILLFGAAIPARGTAFRVTYQKFLPFEP
ncbi:MAG: hypothetical protein HY791_24515 [Deltaproteobacteria bacterium]|nr:hypothetical protein [Deltaproteobacteria bacterium]